MKLRDRSGQGSGPARPRHARSRFAGPTHDHGSVPVHVHGHGGGTTSRKTSGRLVSAGGDTRRGALVPLTRRVGEAPLPEKPAAAWSPRAETHVEGHSCR